LAVIGEPPPSTTPLFYRLSASLLTTEAAIEVVGAETSGEVAAVMVPLSDGLWVGLGSDHTDRKSESLSTALSKPLCPKPIAATLWRFDDGADRWDRLIWRSWVVIEGGRSLCQGSSVTESRDPRDLMSRVSDSEMLAPGTVVICGTMPVLGGRGFVERFDK
jgi:hypothetical protein